MAERFAEHGARARKQEKVDAAASAIRAAGGTAEPTALDVRDYSAVENALPRTHEGLRNR
jgi:NADP-dependent 3-hydroxy acid dehydrogenase YdfG